MNLNNSQKKVIESDFPIFNIAGAGSGKTTTLIEKINSLIEFEDDLKKILVLTFTNKSVDVIYEKLNRKLKTNLNRKNYYIGTFHSIFYKLLKENIDVLLTYYDFKKTIKIIETDDDYRIFKQMLINEVEIFSSKTNMKNKEIEAYIEEKYEMTIKDIYLIYLKQYNLQNDNLNEIIKKTVELSSGVSNDKMLINIFHNYIETKFNNGFVSFNDILFFIYSLQELDIDFKTKLKKQFKYICIDEYQDTNEMQTSIIENFIHNGNIYIVGDPRQNIFGFIGSKIDNMQEIQKKVNNMNVIQLIENYRSTPNIVSFSNEIKNLLENKIEGLEDCVSFSSGLSNNKIKLIEYCNQESEILKDIIYSINYKKIPKNEIAILTRTKNESFGIEKKLREQKLQYRKLGGKGIYDIQYVKEIFSLLKIMSSNYTVKDIYNVFKNINNVGEVTVNKICGYHTKYKMNLYDIIKKYFMKHKNLNNFSELLFEKGSLDYDTFKTILDYEDFIVIEKAIKSGEIISKREEIKKNIDYIINEIKEVLSKKSKKEIEEYLSLMSLNKSVDDDDEKIIISTIHSAKGLEWNNCYILNAEQGKFPIKKSLASQQGIEEEKRLFYVACSRAKENLMITSSNELNEYLTDLKDADYVEYISKNSIKSGWNTNYNYG